MSRRLARRLVVGSLLAAAVAGTGSAALAGPSVGVDPVGRGIIPPVVCIWVEQSNGTMKYLCINVPKL